MLLAIYFLMIELIYIVLSDSPWERYRELLQKQHTGSVVLISLVFGVCLYLHQFLLFTLLLINTHLVIYFSTPQGGPLLHPYSSVLPSRCVSSASRACACACILPDPKLATAHCLLNLVKTGIGQ